MTPSAISTHPDTSRVILIRKCNKSIGQNIWFYRICVFLSPCGRVGMNFTSQALVWPFSLKHKHCVGKGTVLLRNKSNCQENRQQHSESSGPEAATIDSIQTQPLRSSLISPQFIYPESFVYDPRCAPLIAATCHGQLLESSTQEVPIVPISDQFVSHNYIYPEGSVNDHRYAQAKFWRALR